MSGAAHRFSETEWAAVYRAIAERRDMRHFRPDPVEPAALARLLAAAHCVPSVGLMQPWRFLRITDPRLRQGIHSLVSRNARKRRWRSANASGSSCGSRSRGYWSAASCSWRRSRMAASGTSSAGARCRRWTSPRSPAPFKTCGCAARAEGLGLGWVSLFDPAALAQLLAIPEGAKPVAILCLGHVEAFYPAPMLELKGWIRGRPLQELMFHNTWGNTEVSA
jgi:5,6-dimethylbenzimidazole synthase